MCAGWPQAEAAHDNPRSGGVPARQAVLSSCPQAHRCRAPGVLNGGLAVLHAQGAAVVRNRQGHHQGPHKARVAAGRVAVLLEKAACRMAVGTRAKAGWEGLGAAWKGPCSRQMVGSCSKQIMHSALPLPPTRFVAVERVQARVQGALPPAAAGGPQRPAGRSGAAPQSPGCTAARPSGPGRCGTSRPALQADCSDAGRVVAGSAQLEMQVCAARQQKLRGHRPSNGCPSRPMLH